jgi:DNA modification methylase
MKIFSDVKESVENIVHTFSNGGDVVCDPFCNHGGVSKICVENGRSLIANDIDISKTEVLKGVLL